MCDWYNPALLQPPEVSNGSGEMDSMSFLNTSTMDLEGLKNQMADHINCAQISEIVFQAKTMQSDKYLYYKNNYK